jgi:hypothetical protein
MKGRRVFVDSAFTHSNFGDSALNAASLLPASAGDSISIELSALSPKFAPKFVRSRSVMGGDLPSGVISVTVHLMQLHFFQSRLGMPFSIELSALSPKLHRAARQGTHEPADGRDRDGVRGEMKGLGSAYALRTIGDPWRRSCLRGDPIGNFGDSALNAASLLPVSAGDAIFDRIKCTVTGQQFR